MSSDLKTSHSARRGASKRATNQFRFRLSKVSGNRNSPRLWSPLPTGIVPKAAHNYLGVFHYTAELPLPVVWVEPYKQPRPPYKAWCCRSPARNARSMPVAEPRWGFNKLLGWVSLIQECLHVLCWRGVTLLQVGKRTKYCLLSLKGKKGVGGYWDRAWSGVFVL